MAFREVHINQVDDVRYLESHLMADAPWKQQLLMRRTVVYLSRARLAADMWYLVWCCLIS